MPSGTFLAVEEKSSPGFKAANDKTNIHLFGGNVSGTIKLKPKCSSTIQKHPMH